MCPKSLDVLLYCYWNWLQSMSCLLGCPGIPPQRKWKKTRGSLHLPTGRQAAHIPFCSRGFACLTSFFKNQNYFYDLKRPINLLQKYKKWEKLMQEKVKDLLDLVNSGKWSQLLLWCQVQLAQVGWPTEHKLSVWQVFWSICFVWGSPRNTHQSALEGEPVDNIETKTCCLRKYFKGSWRHTQERSRVDLTESQTLSWTREGWHGCRWPIFGYCRQKFQEED